MTGSKEYDAIIVGGGFAGLSAALWLGRFRRSVLVISAGPTRNARAHVLHGYPGFDGGDPHKLLETIKQEAAGYGAEFLDASVDRIANNSATSSAPGELAFVVETSRGNFEAQRIIIATGTADTFPNIPGFKDYMGISIWHCPSCDGHEYIGKKIVIIGWNQDIVHYAPQFLAYSADVTVLTHGHSDGLDETARQRLISSNISVIDDPVTDLQGDDGQISSLKLADGKSIAADAVFYNIKQTPRLELLRDLGCEVKDGAVELNPKQETCIPGVYAAGDIARLESLVVVACATGTIAACSIHESLQE